MQSVSTETGIAKTTLYRRWGSKEDLALAVVLDMTREVVATPADGDIRTSLIAYLDAAVTSLRSTLMGSVMQGLASDLATNPELREKFHTRVVALRRAHLDELVRTGIQRGELRRTVDVDLLHDLLFGPVYYRLLVSGGPLGPGLAADIVDAVIPSVKRISRR
jgi:AcrR family transcriptional regulator